MSKRKPKDRRTQQTKRNEPQQHNTKTTTDQRQLPVAEAWNEGSARLHPRTQTTRKEHEPEKPPTHKMVNKPQQQHTTFLQLGLEVVAKAGEEVLAVKRASQLLSETGG